MAQDPDERPVGVTAASGHRALVDHAVEKAFLARGRFGPQIDLAALQRLLCDSATVRWPTRYEFGTEGILEGMFAVARQIGPRPADGFVITVHPFFRGRDDVLPLLVAYHLVAVNYGEIADATVAERFGATLFGLQPDDYYSRLCALTDELEAAGG